MIVQEIPQLNLPKPFNPETDRNFETYFGRLFDTLPTANQLIPHHYSDPYEVALNFVRDGTVFKILLRVLLDTPAMVINDLKHKSRKNE